VLELEEENAMAIVIVGMLDEREDALRMIQERIEERGHRTVLIDVSVGTGAIVPSLAADVGCEEIASLGATTGGEDTEVSLMAAGLTKKVTDLHRSGELEGIIAITGMTGGLISLAAMKALPFGIPKLLITSSMAMPAHAEQLAQYFALKDITVMHAVVDTVGMNGFVRTLATNGANAISGMVEAGHPSAPAGKCSIAITEFGFCDRGAHYVRQALEEEYEIVSFHSNGLGDQAAMDLVKQGYFTAFIDLVPGAYSEYLLGGNRASGADRLDIAAHQPIPYIFCPGGFDMISCGPFERKEKDDPLWKSRRLGERQLHVQDPLRVQARTSIEEMEQLGGAVAEKLNRYEDKGRVRVMIPRRGFSSLSVEGGPLFDPRADGAFVTALRSRLDPEIAVTEVDTDINSREFAQAVVAGLSEIGRRRGRREDG
jgi:uncharacterized protein (UPF0261 family)